MPPSDECSVIAGGTGLLLRGDVIAPGVLYEGGDLQLDERGVITCVGCGCDPGGATVVSCPGAAIAPGFVNPHDHLAYDATPPRPLGPERYDHRHDWRLGLRGHDAIAYEGGASKVERSAQELRMLLGGVTTLAGGAGVHGLTRNPDVDGFAEGLPTAPADSETFPLDDSDGLFVTSGCGYGKNHADSADVLRAGEFLAHLGEGVDRAAENELDCALSADFGLLGPTSAAVHAVATTARQAAELGAHGTLVVWSPRSNIALYGNTAPVPLLLRSGVEVALGTDWLLSGSMNLLRELACARSLSESYYGGLITDQMLLQMATEAGAHAVGAGDGLGRLAPGALADVLVVAERGRDPVSAVVTAASGDFALILRGGAPLYGRRALLDGLAAGSCEALDVCGVEQAVCVADSGFTLAELQAAADTTYPLFACDTPPDEPTCVPSRPGEYEGTVTASDADGDGVPDAYDLCPSVFDPVRPLDEGAQADADADGVGDACDPCPLDPTPACVDALLGDRDGDGVPDGPDDCPGVADPAQSDADGDLRGDACDVCSAQNPGVFPCPLSIAALRGRAAGGHPPLHALVALPPAVVTALRPDTGSSRGYYIQELGVVDGVTDARGAASMPFSGIFVYTGSASPGVAVGDRVTLTGRYDVYYDLDELVAPSVVERVPGDALEPIVVTAADVGDEGALGAAYDSMLVVVQGARVAATNPDAPSDYDETGLDGALRLDDLLYPELDNTFAPGSGFSAITGIVARSYDHQKLLPRGESDLVP